MTVVGGGLGGLVAAIACAEHGHGVELHEANRELGGRARSSDGPYVVNLGPHALYADGEMWKWLKRRRLLPSTARPDFRHFRILVEGRLRRSYPPLAWAALRLPRRAPVERDYRSWATERVGKRAAEAAIGMLSLPTFDHDPGRLSAAFAQERLRRVTYHAAAVRYVCGGWGELIERLAERARQLGVLVHTGSRVEQLPVPPVIVATSLRAASALIDEPLEWPGARTALFDIGLGAGRRRLASVLDVEGRVYATRVTSVCAGLAPESRDLIQASAGIGPDESIESGHARIETLLDAGFPGWRESEEWRRQTVVERSSGALDLPGRSWSDRPAVERGDGVYLVGDFVAAQGMLSEVSHRSAVAAAARISTEAGGGP